MNLECVCKMVVFWSSKTYRNHDQIWWFQHSPKRQFNQVPTGSSTRLSKLESHEFRRESAQYSIVSLPDVYHPRNVGYTRALQYITETDLETCISGPSTLIWFIRWCQFHPANLQNESEHRGKTMDIADDDATNPNTALLCSVTYANAPNSNNWHRRLENCKRAIAESSTYRSSDASRAAPKIRSWSLC